VKGLVRSGHPQGQARKLDPWMEYMSGVGEGPLAQHSQAGSSDVISAGARSPQQLRRHFTVEGAEMVAQEELWAATKPQWIA